MKKRREGGREKGMEGIQGEEGREGGREGEREHYCHFALGI
jgi:hypothetical protein